MVLSGLGSGARLELRLFVVQQLQSLLPLFAPSLAASPSPLRDALFASLHTTGGGLCRG